MLIGIYSPAPGCGKTTAAEYLMQHGFEPHSFATPIKEMTRRFLLSLGYDFHEAEKALIAKTTLIKGITPPITVRDLLRTLATEWGRDHVHPDVWLKCWRAKYDDLKFYGVNHIVVDDLRFPNEAQLITELGGKLWELRRTDVEAIHQSTHRSDGGLTGYNFDKTIHNNGSIEALYAQLDHLISNQ